MRRTSSMKVICDIVAPPAAHRNNYYIIIDEMYVGGPYCTIVIYEQEMIDDFRNQFFSLLRIYS